MHTIHRHSPTLAHKTLQDVAMASVCILVFAGMCSTHKMTSLYICSKAFPFKLLSSLPTAASRMTDNRRMKADYRKCPTECLAIFSVVCLGHLWTAQDKAKAVECKDKAKPVGLEVSDWKISAVTAHCSHC